MLVNLDPDQAELIISSLEANGSPYARKLAIGLNRCLNNYLATGDSRIPNTDQPSRQFRVNPRSVSHGRN